MTPSHTHLAGPIAFSMRQTLVWQGMEHDLGCYRPSWIELEVPTDALPDLGTLDLPVDES